MSTVIAWTEHRKPDAHVPYDHIIGATSFGRFLITWKGWKDQDWPTIDETPWGEFGGGCCDIDEAKDTCEQAFISRLTAAMQNLNHSDTLPEIAGYVDYADGAVVWKNKRPKLGTAIYAADQLMWYGIMCQNRAAVKMHSKNDAVDHLQTLTKALNNAFISSWQSTSGWQKELDAANDFLSNTYNDLE